MVKDFNEILDDCIDRLNRGEAPDACLARYPEQAKQLEPLLRAMVATTAAYSFHTSADAKRRARQRLYTALDKRSKPSFWGRISANPAAWTALAGVFLLFVAGFLSMRAGVFMPELSIPVSPNSPGGVAGTAQPNSPAGGAGNAGPAVRSTGTVQLWVTDAPRTDNVTEIWVTISAVKIQQAAGTASETSPNTSGNLSTEVGAVVDNSTDTTGWITINLTGPNRFDLLTLTGGLQQVLATANLTEGRYSQILMTVGKVEVKINGVIEDAVLPGGKLRFVRPFGVQTGYVTKLLFDFDADRFVNVTGSPREPKIIVNPVVKLTLFIPVPVGGK